MSGVEKAVTVFVGGLILVAAFTVLVKPGSQTPAVLTSLGKATSGSLSAAEGNVG